jgi:Fic family protein
MNQAISDLETLPLSNRLLRDAHRILMTGVRGERKTPGEFRRSQNWIGGSTLADAVFIPPHHNDLPVLMTDLEAFWHNESIYVPHLIRVAISHYQFETIHPFQDGNGRIGRLLITLYLVSKELLQHPCLYLSAHLEKNRASYYDALSRVRETNDLGHWIRFFLVAVNETAKNATSTFRSIFELRNRTSEIVGNLGRAAPNLGRIVDFLYQKPVVTSPELCKRLELNQSTTDRLISTLVSKGILYEITGQRRNRIFFFKDYYSLFQ